MEKSMFWKEEFNVGVNGIDTAHKALFKELRHVENQLRLEEYQKYDCIETIKFLRDYTLNHFKAEEAYMKSIDYPYYEMHLKLHDNMREETLPAIEEKLRSTNFSKESIQEFYAIFAGWLSGHILVEDRAITGKAQSKFIRKAFADLDTEEVINTEVTTFMKDMLGIDVTLVNKLYDGSHIDKAFMYEVVFNNKYSVAMIVQHPMILHMVSNMMGIDTKVLDKNTIIAYTQLCNSMAKAILEIVYPGKNLEMSQKQGTVNIDFDERFSQGVPVHSMLWTSSKGSLALCVDTLK